MTTLKQMETEARKTGRSSQMIDGIEFEVTRKGLPGSTRCNYRHGSRHMGRDEAESLLPSFVYDPAKMFPFCQDPRRTTG